MTNEELITKIKAEIERRITDNTFGAKLELIDFLAWLDTLESEKPKNQGLDKEIDEISIHVPCSEFTHESEFIDLLDWLKEQFTYFYDLGCRRTAEKYDEIEYNRQRAEESAYGDLEKEVEKCLDEYHMLAVGKRDFTEIARHFAQWGAEHLKK